jgi:hypothetical protein
MVYSSASSANPCPPKPHRPSFRTLAGGGGEEMPTQGPPHERAARRWGGGGGGGGGPLAANVDPPPAAKVLNARRLVQAGGEAVDDDVKAERELRSVLALGEQGSEARHVGEFHRNAFELI